MGVRGEGRRKRREGGGGGGGGGGEKGELGKGRGERGKERELGRGRGEEDKGEKEIGEEAGKLPGSKAPPPERRVHPTFR